MIINRVYVHSVQHNNMCEKDQQAGDKRVLVYSSLM